MRALTGFVFTLGTLLLILAAHAADVSAHAEPDGSAQAEPDRPAENSDADRGTSVEAVTRTIPYEGAFGPSEPPKAPVSDVQTPIEPWVSRALEVWYQRPSPKGPEPIALDDSKAIFVEGKPPVIQALPGPPAFPDKIPERLRTVYPEKIPFTNKITRLAGGEIRLASIDRTLNDTKISDDWMVMEASFTDATGDEWTIEQVLLAPISPNPILEPWLGGVGIDVPYHGNTGNGTPAVPLVNCAMCSWGWADIYKNGKRVASSALVHVMVTSDTRNDDKNFEYYDYDSTNRPVREVHIVVPPSAYLPSPGGFLHVMWENAEITRGAPDEIRSMAAGLEKTIPTIELSAVPYLQWDKQEIRVETGKAYRLIVHNNDPSSFHQFNLHQHPAGHGHHASDLRHEHGAVAGRIGGLYRPGDDDHHASDAPTAPRNVFFPLPQGSTWATIVKFEAPGEYPFMCPVGNHYRRGMKGKFVAVDATSGEKP